MGVGGDAREVPRRTRVPGGPRPPRTGPAAARPPPRPAPPRPGPAASLSRPGLGRTHSMIRETCSRTGTLLSLKAVVMKQPKVSAAITLSEKANSEFARDSTVFIAAESPEFSSTRTPGTPFRSRIGSVRSAPPALRAFRGRAPPRPRLLSGSPSGGARAHLPPGHTHQAAGPRRRAETGPRASPPLHPACRLRQSATSRGGAVFLQEDPPPLP